jgi:hypothetical protein
LFGDLLCQTTIPTSVEAVYSLKNEIPFAFTTTSGSKLKAAYAGLFQEIKAAFELKTVSTKEVNNA